MVPMIFLGGEYALYALEFIGIVLAIIVTLIVALYIVVWGLAFVCAVLDHFSPSKSPKRMQPRCPECDSAKVFGEPGHRICANCGASQLEDPIWR